MSNFCSFVLKTETHTTHTLTTTLTMTIENQASFSPAIHMVHHVNENQTGFSLFGSREICVLVASPTPATHRHTNTPRHTIDTHRHTSSTRFHTSTTFPTPFNSWQMSREIRTRTALPIAGLAPFPGQLASGTRLGLEEAVDQEKRPTRRSRVAVAHQPQSPPYSVFRAYTKCWQRESSESLC